MFDKYKITVDGTEICYIDNKRTDKQVLFFVHGWGADKYNLKAVYDMLESDFRVISVDLPGFGESSVPHKTIGSIDYAENLYKLVSMLGLSRIIFIGHSFGGKIGIVLSVMHPDAVSKMVLIDSTGIRSRRYPSWYLRVYSFKMMKFIFMKILKNDRLTERLKNRLGSTDYKNAGVMRDILVKNVTEDFTDYLPKIKCPVFLYWGQKDKDTPLWMAKKMSRLIKDSGLFVVKNGGHFPFLEDNRIISIIDNFARS